MDEPGRMSASGPGPDVYGTARLEAFSDAIFAITATVLVLTIDIPEVEGGLATALAHQWPVYLAYFSSFLMVGIIWVNHHGMFHVIDRTTHAFLVLNVFFLMSVALVPFPTALVAQYLAVPVEGETAVIIFGALGTLMSLMFNLVWAYAAKGRRLIVPWFPDDILRRLHKRNLKAPVVYAVATLLAFIYPIAAFLLITAISLYYLFPSRMTREWEADYEASIERNRPGVSG